MIGFVLLAALQGAIRLCQVPQWVYCKAKKKPFEWFSFNVQ